MMISLSSPGFLAKDKDEPCFNIKSMLKYYGIRQSRAALLFISILCVFTWLYLSSNPSSTGQPAQSSIHCPRLLNRPRDYVAVQPFKLELHSPDWISRQCFNDRKPNDVDFISSSLNIWVQSTDPTCRTLYNDFKSVYHVREKIAEVTISDTFLVKVRHWLGGNKELVKKTRKQTLVFIDNLFTQESVVFNPVRSKRPGASGGDDGELLKNLVSKSAEDCDFCQYKKLTAQDSFGILESKHAAIVSNTFKIEKFHGMVLLKHHNPSLFSLEQFLDSMSLASKWYEKVHSIVPNHNFRHMYWDVYPKASASQVHPHMHIMLGNTEYYAKWNHFHISALRYAQLHDGANYWTKMIEAHNSIGLATTYGDAAALAYMTPQKDYCTFVISRTPSLNFFKLIYFVYRAFIDDLNLYAYSSGFVFPKMNTSKQDEELPALFSIVYRGSLAGARSDISSFDLFGTANVNVSPYKVIKAIKLSIVKRQYENYESGTFQFS